MYKRIYPQKSTLKHLSIAYLYNMLEQAEYCSLGLGKSLGHSGQLVTQLKIVLYKWECNMKCLRSATCNLGGFCLSFYWCQ